MADVQQNAFMLSSATLMIAPAFDEDVFSLTPSKHSVGMTSEIEVTLNSSMNELQNGVAQSVVDGRRTGVQPSITGNIFEMTSKNFLTAQGAIGSVAAIKTGILLADVVSGAASLSVGGLALGADGTSPIAAITDVPAGSTILIQRAVGESDYVFPTKTSAATTVNGLVYTLSIGGDYVIPNGMSFKAGSRIWVVPPIPVGAIDFDSYFGVKISGTLSNFDRPVVAIFPKVRVVKGFQLSFNEKQYSSMPWELRPLILNRSEASGRLSEVGTRKPGIILVGSGGNNSGPISVAPPRLALDFRIMKANQFVPLMTRKF